MSAVRPEFGPTLPALLQERRGIPPRTTLAVVAAVVAVVGLLAFILSGEQRGTLRVHRADPAFGIIHQGPVRPVKPRADEYMRFAARGRAVRVSLVVAPLPGPAPAVREDLPVRAARHVEALRARFPGFDHQYDARANVNEAPGHEIRFRAGTRERPVVGQDLLLVPSDTSHGPGVLVSLRQRNLRRRLRAVDREVVLQAKKALRSFSFGTDGP